MRPVDIARRRIRNSRLSGDGFGTPEEAVGWHLAMQAQEYGPAKWSIGQRSRGLVDSDVDRALADGSIVRTHVLRPTWHFVAREDLRWLLSLSGPRVQQGNAGRYRQLGLDARARGRAEAVIVAALEGGSRLTRNELAIVLDDAGIDRQGQRLPYLLMHCELEAVICSGGPSGKQQTYALVDDRVPKQRLLDRDDAVAELVRRYLVSHGPATVKDLSWWSGLTMGDVRKAMELLGSEVRVDEVGGFALWSDASDDGRPPAVRGAQLLQVYDELVVGYSESRFVGDPASVKAKTAWSGGAGTLPTGVFLLNGRVGGHWRRTIERKRVAIDLHLYEVPRRGDARALRAAAEELGFFLESPVAVEMKGY
jgi:hypothetical protein